jgi:glutamyl-Q tRNA(Asp) synthetase
MVSSTPFALRMRVPAGAAEWVDRCQGVMTFDNHTRVGDFILKRKEGFYAYHLAVVVDDASQGITHVVRGIDLLDSTPCHLILQQALGYPAPHYAHLPVILDADGKKLSKQTYAPPVNTRDASGQLTSVLGMLGQKPYPEAGGASPKRLLEWAIAHWDLMPLKGVRELPAIVG